MPSFPTVYIKHKGLFDKEKLVKGLQKWFDANKFDFHAKKYKAKANEFEIEIEGKSEVTEYLQFKIAVWIRAWELKKIEVIEEGKKTEKNHGRLAIEVTSSYELDYKKRFGGNKILQAMQDFLHKYVLKRTIEEEWEEHLFIFQNNLVKFIKNTLSQEVQ